MLRFGCFTCRDEGRTVAQRAKIELVEDAPGVRIDVMTPQRVDLGLREVHKGFAHRSAEAEAIWLGAAEAFLRGDERSHERTHPDSLFQITVSGARGGAWDIAEIRVSIPGDITGALARPRY